jgi:LacI family transcriptional regulator
MNMVRIAEHLSLSRSTISSVLNDKWREKNISEATATRVMEYVEEIGYAPNLVSLTLKGKVAKDLQCGEGHVYNPGERGQTGR